MRAREIGIHMQNFYDNLESRSEQIDKNKSLENVKVFVFVFVFVIVVVILIL
jgi:hypothetical protein